jgi:hypothetical protein
MIKTAKIVTIALTIIIVLGGLAFFGLRQLTRSIYSQRTCDWANIDNIEMHAGVDIPNIKTCDCEYNKGQNTKAARFDLDKGSVDMNRYIKINNFKKLNSTSDISFDELLKKDVNFDQLMSSADLYYTKGSYQGETWQTLLDNSTGRLWVTIKYKD